MRFIQTLKEGDHVLEHYFCKDKQKMVTKAGKNYFNVTLQDKTGTLNAKIWDLSPQIFDFNKNQMVKIDAQITSYQGDLQANIYRIRPSEPGEYDLADFIRQTNKDVEQLYQGLIKRINEVRDPKLRQLLQSFFVDDAKFIKKFKEHPAAKSVHHNYLGGLIEHVSAVVENAVYMADAYPGVDRDLVITGAMLHDIGKVRELTEMPVAEYTDAGQMLGHIILGYNMVQDRMNRLGAFPRSQQEQLLHIILAHHGELEFGSPKVPMTREAMIVHFADNIDAKMKVMETFVEEDPSDGHWTAFNRFLNRNLYKPEKKEPQK